ncbi:MAG: hypothetical protein V1729_02830 [Candidatus Woesearchaeota archaeon]
MIDDHDFIKQLKAQADETTKSICDRQKKLDIMAAEAASIAKTIDIQKKFVDETEELRRTVIDQSEILQSLQEQKSALIERINQEESLLVRTLAKAATLVHRRQEAQTEFSRQQEPDIDAYVESALNDASTDKYMHLIAHGAMPTHPRRHALWGRMIQRKREHVHSDQMKERHIGMYNDFAEDRRKILKPYEMENNELAQHIKGLEGSLNSLTGKANESLVRYMDSVKKLNPKKPEEHINTFNETHIKELTLTQVIEADVEIAIEHIAVIRTLTLGSGLSIQFLDVRKYMEALKYLIENIDPSDTDTIDTYGKHLESLFAKVHPTNKVKVGKYDPDLNERIEKTAMYTDEQFKRYTEMIIAEPMDDQNLVIGPEQLKELKTVYETMLPKFDQDESFNMKYALLRRPPRMVDEIKLRMLNLKRKYRNSLLEILERKISLLSSEDYMRKAEVTASLTMRYLKRFVQEHHNTPIQESQAQIMERIAQRVYEERQAEQYRARPDHSDGSILDHLDKPEIPKLAVISGGKS